MLVADVDELAMARPLTLVLLVLYHDRKGDGRTARRFLGAATQSFAMEEADRAQRGGAAAAPPAVPRRTTVDCLLEAGASYLLERGLESLASRALVLADQAEAACLDKARRLGKTGRAAETPARARTRALLLSAQLKLRTCAPPAGAAAASGGTTGGSAGGGAPLAPEASAALDEAADVAMLAAAGDEAQRGAAWRTAGDAHRAAGRLDTAADSYAQALELLDHAPQSRAPLEVHLRLGALYAQLGRLGESRARFVRAVDCWQSPSAWLGAGIAALRLDELHEAGEALRHANVRDPHNAATWGYLALHALASSQSGASLCEQAKHALGKAFSLGLHDAALLRELGQAFYGLDEPDAAERCLRRALSGAAAADDDAALAGGNGAERHTRRRLADVLKATEADAGAAADAPKPSQYKRVVKAIETAPPGDDAEELAP